MSTNMKLPDCVPYEQKMREEDWKAEENEKWEKLVESLEPKDIELLKEAHEESESTEPYEVWLNGLNRAEIYQIIF